MRFWNRFKKFLEQMKDQKLNRELVGVDRFGNKYYQYYSYYGLPTRREIEFIADKRIEHFEDKAFYFWWRKYDLLPPSQADLNKYYLEEEERKKKAVEWDKKELLLIQQFYKNKEIEGKVWEQAQIGSEEGFKPENWVPGQKPRTTNKEAPPEEK